MRNSYKEAYFEWQARNPLGYLTPSSQEMEGFRSQWESKYDVDTILDREKDEQLKREVNERL